MKIVFSKQKKIYRYNEKPTKSSRNVGEKRNSFFTGMVQLCMYTKNTTRKQEEMAVTYERHTPVAHLFRRKRVVGGLTLAPAQPPLKLIFHQAFMSRWQSSPMQMKCTCNANQSTYILYEFIFKWGTLGVLFHDFGKKNQKILKCIQHKMYCVVYPNATTEKEKTLTCETLLRLADDPGVVPPVEDEAGPPAGAVVGSPARSPLKPLFHQAFHLFHVGMIISPTQMKCTCDANRSTCILDEFHFQMGYIRGSVSWFWRKKKIKKKKKKILKCIQHKMYCIVYPNTTKKVLVESRLSTTDPDLRHKERENTYVRHTPAARRRPWSSPICWGRSGSTCWGGGRRPHTYTCPAAPYTVDPNSRHTSDAGCTARWRRPAGIGTGRREDGGPWRMRTRIGNEYA